ncbi:hypothetical protein AWC02_15275 [Mycolicibacter engbaekii]|uniref:Antitoxin Xre/MbcA/ParS-like toxin-binding domain-containing protein n=1 Tax=Mycolicibacter engbaekii TaxID=188915 RepID=A0A1X1TFP9_9MYCO|nr:hypothetical protein [Mycolicibacter engbaekii]ORV43366.1 hypothetical protein AWC02_15275 [Mycolicibacter engbaekii]
MPVPTEQKVTALIHDLGPERLAYLLDVDPAQLVRWRRGDGIDEANASRVDLLEAVMASLLRLFPIEAAQRWLVGLNPELGDRRPADLIRRGRSHEVLDAVASARAISFA